MFSLAFLCRGWYAGSVIQGDKKTENANLLKGGDGRDGFAGNGPAQKTAFLPAPGQEA